MTQIVKNISLLILSFLVIFLSVGLSVSEMRCSELKCPEYGKLFIGSDVPNCLDQKNQACDMFFDDVSCCKTTEIETSCCSENEDDACASETTNIQFDFETITSSFEFDFKQIGVLLFTFFIYDQVRVLKPLLNYSNAGPLLQLSKPNIKEIQSFLL